MVEAAPQDAWLSAHCNHRLAKFHLDQTNNKIELMETGIRRLTQPWICERGRQNRAYRRAMFQSFATVFAAERAMRKHGIITSDGINHPAVIRFRQENPEGRRER